MFLSKTSNRIIALRNNWTTRLHPAVAPLRAFSTTDADSPSITLFQYKICPFCNIVKACLAYGKLSYKVIEVNPLTKSEIKSFEYSKVPILTLNEEKLYGSDKIVERLLEKNLKITSDSPSAKKWTNFAKEELAPLLYPNLCSSLSNSYKAFEYVHSVDSFSTLQKYSIQSVGSLAMYMAASKIKKKRNISDERQALHEALKLLEVELSKSESQCLEKNQPGLGDLWIYGVLRGLEGLPVHDEIMSEYEEIPLWYHRMRKSVEA